MSRSRRQFSPVRSLYTPRSLYAMTALPEFSIAGKTAVITGASQGLGRGIAQVFAEAGVDLCIAARSLDKLTQAAADLRRHGHKCIPVQADITNAADVERLAATAIMELGHVDILINNAGIGVFKPLVPLPGFNPPTARDLPNFFAPTSEEEWFRVLNTNLTGAFLCMRALGPHMLARKQGRVINISSANAAKAGRYRFSYDASKAALSMLTRSMAVEWARYNINVTAIGSGYVETELLAENMADPRLKEKLLSEIPMRRLGTEREVGLLAAYLAAPASAWLTGQTVFLDGGILA
ncbi:MAG: SDR family oxidoreductase [Dehalococcoidia bacterium]|nr:SDR family oxidoreductase [Dehalococcoidia bacterium]